MCKRDPLFFLNSFVLLYEPRTEPPEVRPFNTYPYQDRAILLSLERFGKTDIGVEKSRDMGASWLFLALFLWRWLFFPMGDYMIMSRKEEEVDSTENRKALMVKLDFMLSRLPGFLRPRRYTRTRLKLSNDDNGSVITGSSTTGDAGRGGRNTAILIDEFAAFQYADGYEALSSTQYNTRTRIFVSTPKGDSGAYYDMMHNNPSLLKLRFHWSEHPEQSRGLYTTEKGELKILDEGYPFPADYPFILDGKLRSPYYDEEEKRSPSPQYLARELDIDYGGSNTRVFDSSVLDRLIVKHATPPAERIPLRRFLGEERSRSMPEGFWNRAQDAEILLWANRNDEGKLPDDRLYVMGCDISAGTGASNSVLSVFDCKTRRKVLKLIHNRIMATEFADLAVAIARWLEGSNEQGAYMIWEVRGPGTSFGQRVIDLGYRNVYHKTNERSLSRKETDTPGWHPTPENKLEVIERYRDALAAESVINPSEDALNECREFIYTTHGVKHKRDADADDPSGKNQFHGDQVIADALAVFAMEKEVRIVQQQTAKIIVPGSRLWRDQVLAQRQKQALDFWSRRRVRAC